VFVWVCGEGVWVVWLGVRGCVRVHVRECGCVCGCVLGVCGRLCM
jgi:hypothetical protein